ncbi:FAD-dependent oxidoreductase [Streptomyces sp. RP5T]|uniref:FAD-dependent oxidoreductase n=1 Tax=Streptomyces sp. RP5T TaxID=2490848 RepID=UPI000F64F84E|nr:FAD-dependent oxidoreductase [Streptomyces sp. RP5T]RRR86075.1 FAD-binding protein [Streptomyces sp. RP5T]
MTGQTRVDGRIERHVDVAVIGAGPAGLAAAAELARRGAGQVEVLEREQQAGGIPRHSHHTGYGLRDLYRVMSGPTYAGHCLRAAQEAGATIRTGVSVTGWDEGTADKLTLETTSREGLGKVTARAVVLATGARERPRTARLVAGSRPAGIYTTGQLQQTVYTHDLPVGREAVIIGAEHVSYSALTTLAHAGVKVRAMVTHHDRAQTYQAFRIGAQLLWRTPVLTETTVEEILGRRRVEGVVVRHADGRRATLACDTVVFTGDWIPDHELARHGGVPLDPGTLGPAVDTDLSTPVPGVFAAGNVLHAVETADVAALDGRAVAQSVLRHLAGTGSSKDLVPVRVDEPLLWVAPNLVSAASPAPPRGRFILWSSAVVPNAAITVTQDGRILHRRKSSLTLLPGRPRYLKADWLTSVDDNGGPVRVRVESA